ncbi:MAG: GyrI-like domain-containing protein [Methanobacteriota archaeon]
MGLFGGDKIKVKLRGATAIAFIEAKGPYGKIPYDEMYGKLFAWAKESGSKPGFSTLNIYDSDPNVTPEAELATRVAIPLYKAGEPKGEVVVGQLAEMEVAVKKFEGPSEGYNAAYAELGKWIADNGYNVAGPPMEVFTKKPKVKDGKTIIYSEIQFPVAKK